MFSRRLDETDFLDLFEMPKRYNKQETLRVVTIAMIYCALALL